MRDQSLFCRDQCQCNRYVTIVQYRCSPISPLRGKHLQFLRRALHSWRRVLHLDSWCHHDCDSHSNPGDRSASPSQRVWVVVGSELYSSHLRSRWFVFVTFSRPVAVTILNVRKTLYGKFCNKAEFVECASPESLVNFCIFICTPFS